MTADVDRSEIIPPIKRRCVFSDFFQFISRIVERGSKPLHARTKKIVQNWCRKGASYARVSQEKLKKRRQAAKRRLNHWRMTGDDSRKALFLRLVDSNTSRVLFSIFIVSCSSNPTKIKKLIISEVNHSFPNNWTLILRIIYEKWSWPLHDSIWHDFSLKRKAYGGEVVNDRWLKCLTIDSQRAVVSILRDAIEKINSSLFGPFS